MKVLRREGKTILPALAASFTIAIGLSLAAAISVEASTASDFDEAAKLFGNAKFEEALSYLDRSVDAEPTNGKYHYWRARCLSELGRQKESIAEFKVAILLSNDSQVKSDAKSELDKLNVAAPAGSAVASSGQPNLVSDPLSNREQISSVSLDNAGAAGSASATNQNKPNSISSNRPAAQSKNERRISEVDGTPILKAGHKTFKLSSKKLEWDLKLSSDFKNKLASENQKLDSLARNTRWSLPNLQPASPILGSRGRRFDLAEAITRGPAHFGGALSEGERNTLRGSDIVFILDHSGSMSHPDCPAGTLTSNASGIQSRLSWCVEEITAFADRIVSALPHGFTLITFDSKPDVYPIGTASQLHDALGKLEGSGGTDLAAALNEAYRIHAGHPKQPLLIVLVTDAEIDVRSSEQTILEGCKRFPNGMFITLMQIGISAEGNTADTLALLDDLPRKSGAPYDPVEAIPFSQVRRDGFGRDMLLGIQRNYYANRSIASGEKNEAGKTSSQSSKQASPSNK